MTIKDIIDSIKLYFDFINDLVDLGFVSLDNLNNLNDFYIGELVTYIYFEIRKYSELWKNIEQITAHFPNFDPEFFVEQTQKIQDIISDTRFENWQEIWILGQSCQLEVNSAKNCIENIKTVNLKAIIDKDSTDFDGLRHDLDKGIFCNGFIRCEVFLKIAQTK